MNNLFGPYEGYIKGNNFKKLYEQYKNYQPAKLVPLNEFEEAWLNLSQLEFQMLDINLYLDVYPNDQAMINRFNELRTEYAKQLDMFNKFYGPLMANDSQSDKRPWLWVARSWPWDGGKF